MGKLYAMESADDLDVSAVPEVSPEEGAAATAEADMQPEGEEIASDTAGIDEGMQAADQLEELQETVAETVEEGEGLPPVAAEAVRIALEAICARVGANPKSVYSLYATENFKSQSSRIANTKIALEGIGEFLKDLWKKIKAALSSIWQKAVDFFKKHFSSLGAVKKALESAKTKISESSGKVKDRPYIDEAPSSLVEAFAGKTDINKTVIDKYIKTHEDLTGKLKKVNDDSLTFNASISTLIAQKTFIKSDLDTIIGKTLTTTSSATKPGTVHVVNFGKKDTPLIGGRYITYTYTIEDEGNLTVDVDRETIDDTDTKLGLSIADKSGLQEIIKRTLDVINMTIKETERFVDKCQPNTNKLLYTVEQNLEKVKGTLYLGSNKNNHKNVTPEENVKTLRTAIKFIYKYTGQTPSKNKELVVQNVRLARAVLGYVSVCLNNFKSE